jgi:hypothetical protein
MRDDEASGNQAVRVRGVCRAIFAFDVGRPLDLPALDARFAETAPRRLSGPLRRAPAWLRLQLPPLRVERPFEPVALGAFRTGSSAECTLFEFGVVSVSLPIAIDDRLVALPALAESLYDSAPMLAAARRAFDALRADLDLPGAADPSAVEDYVTYALPDRSPAIGVDVLIDRHGDDLAAIVAADTAPFSAQQTRDAIAGRLSYGSADVTIVHWNAAIVFDREADDIVLLLEHANAALLRLRTLDEEVGRLLERSRSIMATGRRRLWQGDRDVRRLAVLHADTVLRFEATENAIKIIGDQYLARVHALASERLHLPRWGGSVLRKLETATSVFDRIVAAQTTRRMEILEIIIILLILFEIVRSLLVP